MSEPIMDKAAWYVVHAKPRQESRALQQLRNQGYLCFLPTMAIEKKCGGKLITCEEPLFSRYLFIRLSQVRNNWSAIRSTRGVCSLLAFGGRYASLPDALVEALQNRPAPLPQKLFAPGESIAIASGPLAGLAGIYQAHDGAARALILVELMSQPQMLRLPVDMLRKAA